MVGVSIIVPVKGNANLKTLLNSIKYCKYEVIIVGDTSSNIDLNNPYINFIETKEKRSEARNIGAKHAKFDILFFLDSDMELSDNFMDAALIKISEYDALIFPEISLGKTIIAMGRRFERIGLYKSLYFEAPRMIKKSVFNNINGYNKHLNAFEDLDLTRKLLNNNFKIGWSGNIILHHEENVNFIDYIKKRIYYTKINKGIFLDEDNDFFYNMTEFKYRYNSFLNSIRYYKIKSIYYLPFYLMVTLINGFTFMAFK
ncbi:glycosyltransferase family 2 protein [Cuniculiplasma sp. SKW3]|uniref:glycosyltransferase family 2 protein n=1 Tax=unclassified Cuniculiplasma TaxID=2619706 RepID=UPI003FD46143